MSTTKFFASKQQYVDFRKAFAAAHLALENKKTKSVYGTKSYGWLTPAHFMLLNIVRGIPWYRGFSPKTSKAFIEAGGNPPEAINAATYQLSSVIQSARILLEPKSIKMPSFYTKKADQDKYIANRVRAAQNHVNKFLAPFNGSMTLVDLANITLLAEPNLNDLDYDKVAGTMTTYVAMLSQEQVS